MPSTSSDWLFAELEARQTAFYFTGGPQGWTAHLRRREDAQWDLGHGETPAAALDALQALLEDGEDDTWRNLI